MKCTICGKEYQTYSETKACYDSHPTQEPTEEKQTSPLDELNHLFKQRSEAPKRITPKRVAIEGETSDKTNVDRLLGLAKDSDSNGHGKLTLAQARFELSDRTLQLSDLKRLIEQNAADVIVEPKPGNTLYIYFGKTARRKAPVLVNPKIPQLDHPKHIL